MSVVAVDEQPRRNGRERKPVVSVYDEATAKKKSDNAEKKMRRMISLETAEESAVVALPDPSDNKRHKRDDSASVIGGNNLAVNDDEYDDDEYDDDDNSQLSVEADFDFEESDDDGDINDESCLVMKNPEDSEEKSRTILDNTFRHLAKENKGPYCNSSPEDIERNKKSDIILVKIAECADKYIANHCTDDGNGSLKFRCRAMQGAESKKPGVYRGKCKNDRYKTGASNGRTSGMRGRIVQQGLNPNDAFILATTEELRNWIKDDVAMTTLLKSLIGLSYQCHPDKYELAFDHALTFTFEWRFMCLFKGIPGYAMEQFYIGSIELRKKLRQAQPYEATIIESLNGLCHDDIHILLTWCTQDTAVLNHLRAHADGDTQAGYNAMKRTRDDDFLQRHLVNGVWGEQVNEFKDGLDRSQTFDNLTSLVAEINNSLSSCNNNTTIATTIKHSLSSIDNNSNQKEHYVTPDPTIFSNACKKLFLDKCHSIIGNKSSANLSIIDNESSVKLLIVMERDYIKSFNNNFMEEHLEYVCDRLYKVKCKNAEIYVYLTGSYHIICGAAHHTQVARINGIISLMADLRLLLQLQLISKESYYSSCGIFTRCAVSLEGLGGTMNAPIDGTWQASLLATGTGYVITTIKPGVKALGTVLSFGAGMNSHHVIALYVLLGQKNFAKMMKIVFNIDVGSRMDEFLKRLTTLKVLRMKLLEFRLNQERNTSTITTAIDATEEEVNAVIESFDSQRSQTHLLASRRSRISQLLGAGGVQQVKDALARGGKSLADATDQELNVIIKSLQSSCPGRKAFKTMSSEEESQLNEKISLRHQESLKNYDECLGNEFIERTGEWKDRKTGKWSMEEINIIMDAEGHWKEKNMYHILARRLEGRGAGQVGNWIRDHNHKKSSWPKAIEWLCRYIALKKVGSNDDDYCCCHHYATILTIAIDVTEMVKGSGGRTFPTTPTRRSRHGKKSFSSPTTCLNQRKKEAMKASTMTSFDRTSPLFERNTVSFEVVTSSSVNDANTSNASNNTKQHGRFTVRILQGHRQQKNGGGGAMERVIRFEMSDECNLIADSSETHQSTLIANDIPLTPTPPMIHFPLMTADRGRTQSTMMQTISQKAVHSSGGRKLLHSKEEMNHHIPSRPIELYELEVGESDFENLRRDQALLVDFQDFANSLISLMQFCEMGDISDSMPPQQQQQQQQHQDQYVFPYVGGRDTQTDNHHTSQHPWGNNDGSWSTPSQARQQGQQGMLPRMTSPYGKLNSAMPHISKYTCRLERESSASSDEGNQWKSVAKSSTSCARFSIVESNQFRELTHLALSLNVGTDKSVRLYLSSRLSQAMAQTRRVQSICEEHQHRSNTAETELISLRKVVHELTQSSEAEKRQLRYQTEEQLQATNSSHSAEINEVKVAKDAEIKVLIERCEKNRLVHENKIRLLEDVNAKINAEKLASENETERLATKLSFHEATNNALSNELNSLRDKLQHVSEEKSSIEKSLHQLQLQLSSLHYSNDSREKMISQTESNRISAEQVSADAKRTLSSQHSQMEDLRRKLEEAELETLKYKDLTSRYQTNRLEMKKRLKEKVEILRESSDVLVVKEKESSELKGQVRSLEEKLQRVQSEKDATSRELSDALRQMKEDKTKLENNQQVIAWLNKQLSSSGAYPTPISTTRLGPQVGPSRYLPNVGGMTSHITPDIKGGASVVHQHHLHPDPTPYSRIPGIPDGSRTVKK